MGMLVGNSRTRRGSKDSPNQPLINLLNTINHEHDGVSADSCPRHGDQRMYIKVTVGVEDAEWTTPPVEVTKEIEQGEFEIKRPKVKEGNLQYEVHPTNDC